MIRYAMRVDNLLMQPKHTPRGFRLAVLDTDDG